MIFGAGASASADVAAASRQEPSEAQANQQGAVRDHSICCKIPAKPVGKSLTSFAGVWQEYKYGTESKPSIKQLIHDHGSAWQKAEYGYQRKVWFKKKKVISAVYALRHILSVSETGALKQLEDQRKITPKVQGQGNMAIHEFVEKFLPRLDDSVHVSGKCKTEGGWRSITSTDCLLHGMHISHWYASSSVSLRHCCDCQKPSMTYSKARYLSMAGAKHPTCVYTACNVWFGS